MARTKSLKQTVTIKRNEDQPESMELIADSIIKIAKAFSQINNSRLKKRTVILLIRDATNNKILWTDIEKVLDAATVLDTLYLKPGGKKA